MRMRVSIAAALLLLPLAGCATGPATLGEPAIQGEAAVPSIAGTTWEGTDVHGDHYVYEFLEDGTLRYTTHEGSWTNGTWTQDGARVYMETNQRYAERVGTIAGSKMTGRGWNVTGLKWTWEAERK